MNESLSPVHVEPQHPALMRVLGVVAPLLLTAACGMPGIDNRETPPQAPSTTAEASDVLVADSEGTEGQQAVYWAEGGGDGSANDIDLERAEAHANRANKDERAAAKQAVSKGAEETTKFWANGPSGSADDTDLEIARGFAEIAARNGSRGDDAYMAISKGAAATAATWKEGRGSEKGEFDNKMEKLYSQLALDYKELAEQQLENRKLAKDVVAVLIGGTVSPII